MKKIVSPEADSEAEKNGKEVKDSDVPSISSVCLSSSGRFAAFASHPAFVSVWDSRRLFQVHFYNNVNSGIIFLYSKSFPFISIKFKRNHRFFTGTHLLPDLSFRPGYEIELY